ncbi:MAG: S41 family peptidase [Defluviitaleaceae bacterium]|nr:S41 family peptidase [Defluviitaleaceae bacterium]
MEKRKPFVLGILVGMAIMIGVYFGISPIRSHMLWGGHLPPEAKILEIYSILNNHSIVPFERDVLLDNMYRGLLEGVGDPYTYYFNREALAVFTERTEGIYAGVGMIVTMDLDDNRVTVVTVFAGSPAEESGLLPGDKIIEVDGVDMSDKRMEEVIALVKGTPGTQVRLGILRGSDTFNINITRQLINVPTVNHQMLAGGIGYIRIESFERVTYNQFVEAYLDLRNQGVQGLIIDVRNNPGGLLETVVDIGNLLLPSGSVLYSENKQGERTVYRSDDNRRIDLPLVMLVNGGSASASEVLTGAVRDHQVGTVVGQQTFGKGVVQSLYLLSDGSAVKVTVATYYTPNGISIHDEGIVPDYIIEVDRDTAMMAARLTLEEDVQLQKAIEVMGKKLEAGR